jgi:hypothetical protein
MNAEKKQDGQTELATDNENQEYGESMRQVDAPGSNLTKLLRLTRMTASTSSQDINNESGKNSPI